MLQYCQQAKWDTNRYTGFIKCWNTALWVWILLRKCPRTTGTSHETLSFCDRFVSDIILHHATTQFGRVCPDTEWQMLVWSMRDLPAWRDSRPSGPQPRVIANTNHSQDDKNKHTCRTRHSWMMWIINLIYGLPDNGLSFFYCTDCMSHAMPGAKHTRNTQAENNNRHAIII